MSKDARDDAEWERVRKLLPDDLEATAHITGAVKRKLRKFDSVATLLRLMLVYAISDWSARLAVGWADGAKIVAVSDVMLLKHLATAHIWLAWLFTQQLREMAGCVPVCCRFTIVLCDATTVNRPGKTGTDYRVHLVLSLTRLFMVEAEVTDHQGGETMGRFAADEGQLWVGDRGFGYRKSIWAIVKTGAKVLVRLGWQAMRLLDDQGQPIDLLQVSKAAQVGVPLEIPVTVAADPKQGISAFSARLIVVRKTKEQTERTRCALRKRYSKLARVAKENTLAAAEYVWLLTTASAKELPAANAAALYRLRWQVEICFKRQKSILKLDELDTRTDAATKAVLYAKLLAMVLCERTRPLQSVFAMEGVDVPEGTTPPLWRVQQVLWDTFKKALGMFLSLAEWEEAFPRVMRRLREPSRQRTRARTAQWEAALFW